jgi:hypothetical protein
MQGTYIHIECKVIGILQQRWQQCGCKDGASKVRARGQWHGARPAQARQGQCNNGAAKVMTGERENG